MTGFSIGSRHVGDGAPCLIVGEVGLAHDGSLGQAHAYVDAIANAGADAVKFQAHIAEAESWPEEPWRVKPEWPQDASRYAYWQRTSFTQDQWAGLARHAQDRGLIFLCSPFSVEAVRMLDPLVPAWKVASGELGNVALLNAIKDTKKPVIMSSGMSTWSEVCVAAGRFSRVLRLQCTSMYPTPAEKVGLCYLTADSEWSADFDGLSDHSGTIWPSIAAVTLGASIVEVHVTLSRESWGFDVSSSITTQELRQLVEGVRFIEKAKQPVDKDQMARELQPMRDLFMDRHKRRVTA